jgi:hypothetical protein
MNFRRMFLAAALTFALFSLFIPTAGAQRARSIKGTVVDEKTGQPIAAAQVFLLAMDARWVQATKTDAKGEYTCSPGGEGRLFQMIVQAKGYKIIHRENVRLEAEQMREENFRLVAGMDTPADLNFLQNLRQLDKEFIYPILPNFFEKYFKLPQKPGKLHLPEYLQDIG